MWRFFKAHQDRFLGYVWQLMCKLYKAKPSMKRIAGLYKICVALNTRKDRGAKDRLIAIFGWRKTAGIALLYGKL